MRSVQNIFFFFLVNHDLFCPHWSYKDIITIMYPKYFNANLWPYHLSCFISSFLYDPAYEAWIFEKFFFWTRSFLEFWNHLYSGKTDNISEKMLVSLFNFLFNYWIYYSVSWSHICTPFILVSASIKMAGISTTVIYNSMRADTLGELLI